MLVLLINTTPSRQGFYQSLKKQNKDKSNGNLSILREKEKVTNIFFIRELQQI